MSYFHKLVKFSKATFTTYIAKTCFPLLQQIADSLKKIGLVGTLDTGSTRQWLITILHVNNFYESYLEMIIF